MCGDDAPYCICRGHALCGEGYGRCIINISVDSSQLRVRVPRLDVSKSEMHARFVFVNVALAYDITVARGAQSPLEDSLTPATSLLRLKPYFPGFASIRAHYFMSNPVSCSFACASFNTLDSPPRRPRSKVALYLRRGRIVPGHP